MQIYPALNYGPDQQELVIQRLESVRGATDMVHLDVCDGTFTDNVAWGDPRAWKEIAGDIKLQVHLMVTDPEAKMKPWLDAGAQEIVIHLEVLSGDDICEQIDRMRASCHATGAKLVLAHGIAAAAVDEFALKAAYADSVLVLTVPPGRAGQSTDNEAVTQYVAALRALLPETDICIDGSVNRETIPQLRAAGASRAVAASAVWKAHDPATELATLQLM